MRDTDLIILFTNIIGTQLIAQNYTDVTILATNQPTQQGVRSGPTIYYNKVFDTRYGFPKRENQIDPDDFNTLLRIETQYIETTFQISTLVVNDPAAPDTYTASDLANTVAMMLASEYSIDTLRAAGVGILRITDIRIPVFTDDRERFETNPNFDFVLTHKRVNIARVPIAQSAEIDIYKID